MFEANVTLVRRAFDEVASQGKLDVVDEIIAPDFVRHDLAGTPDVVGVEGVKRMMAGLRTAFAGLQLTLESVVAQDDMVVARFTGRGTHQGPFQGIAPTGKQVTWAGINIYRIAGGKIAETWQLSDTLGILRQLGAVPAPR